MQSSSSPRQVLRVPQRVVVVAQPAAADSEGAAALGAANALLSIDSGSLLRGGKCVEIVHNGSTYKLQATKLGKLILTK